MIARQIGVSDEKRFLLGSILPDGVAGRDKDRSHFKVRTDALTYIDFEAFRTQYLPAMQQDDLYLGYYMHLVEDALYRSYIYQDRFTMPRCREEVEALHRDYHILNAHIVGRYHLRNILQGECFPQVPAIGGITDFRIRDSLTRLGQEFTEQTEGATVYLTEAMVDEFIETALPVAMEEVKHFRTGAFHLKVRDYTWAKRSSP